jgi:hypothetical protein
MMTPEHPAWQEFLSRINEELDPTLDANGNVRSWELSGDFTFAVAACRGLGLTGDEILDSVEYWRGRALTTTTRSC